MKKRIVSLLLTLSILFGIAVPSMTPQADAVFGTVLGTSLKMCTSLVNGCIKACQNDADGSVGEAVLALFKYTASDFTGIDFGGSSGSTTQETVIQKVDLSQVETELKSINTELQKKQRSHLSAAKLRQQRSAQPVSADGGPEPADQRHQDRAPIQHLSRHVLRLLQ